MKHLQNCLQDIVDPYIPELEYGCGGTEQDDPEALALGGGIDADEALVMCVNKYGIVDLPYMSLVSGLSVSELICALGGKAIFQDPAWFEDQAQWDPEEGWVLRPRYLSGNIPAKLEQARRMNARFPGCFQENTEALKAILPTPLDLEEIHVSLGASWIPAEIYAAFIQQLLRHSRPPEVTYQKELGRWFVRADATVSRYSVLDRDVYGTRDIPAIRIIEQTMNAKTVKVYDYTGYDSENRVLNQAKTMEAQERQSRIIREFRTWVGADSDRRVRLQECYNDALVGYCFSPYDGSFLTLPDMNPEVTLYQHQKNAVARVLLSGGNVLLAHDVGTGKTYEMIVAAHELHRMGLSEKTMMVVPNNILGATVDAHRFLYPDDAILAVFPKDFTPAKRNEVLEQIRDESYVCAYIAYSSFDMISMSKDYYIEKKRKKVDDLLTFASNASTHYERSALTAEANRLEKKLSEYVVKTKESPWLSFDRLGIQTLFVDEAQNYKNIPIASKADNIVGLHGSGSRKCREMLEKCGSVERLIFATGTPLTNSLADLYVLQTYLQPEELRFRKIDSFDMWINTFGNREASFEVDVDSSSLRIMTRFSSFHNLTELMGLFSTVCDFFKGGSDIRGLPQFGGYTDVVTAKSREQVGYIRHLAKRTELIRAHKVKRTKDNLLKVTTDGRKAALDIRLIPDAELQEAGAAGNPFTQHQDKVRACADKLLELYTRYPDTCQLVFSDLGTPNSRSQKVDFNVYDSLKSELELRGIPASEVAYIHEAETEAARKRLFAAVNHGMVRVIIGSTEKLGVGVNIQERLIALHHLSVPWRPADIVQREGRILRQGNTCEEVFIFRYITEGTFDSYSWQILENKQRFISNFLAATNGNRTQEDISDTVLSYAEIKALAIGNPLVKKRVEISNRLSRARMNSRRRQKQMMELRTLTEIIPERLREMDRIHQSIRLDTRDYRRSKIQMSRKERIAFGKRLLARLDDNQLRAKERLFGTYQGLSVFLPANMLVEKPYVHLRGSEGSSYYVDMNTDKPLGCTMRLDHTLEGLEKRDQEVGSQMQELRRQRLDAQKELDLGNPYEIIIEELEEQLAGIDTQLANI